MLFMYIDLENGLLHLGLKIWNLVYSAVHDGSCDVPESRQAKQVAAAAVSSSDSSHIAFQKPSFDEKNCSINQIEWFTYYCRIINKTKLNRLSFYISKNKLAHFSIHTVF